MFRYTFRDLLWLMVAVALGVGWALRERQLGELKGWVQRAEILKKHVEADGLKVEWEGSGVSFTKVGHSPNPHALRWTPGSPPPASRR